MSKDLNEEWRLNIQAGGRDSAELHRELLDYAMGYIWECSKYMRFWAPKTIPLHELYGVPADDPDASIEKARAYFTAHPNKIEVTRIEEEGALQSYEYAVVRVRSNQIKTPWVNLERKNIFVVDWIIENTAKKIAEQLDKRFLDLVRSIEPKMRVIDGAKVGVSDYNGHTGFPIHSGLFDGAAMDALDILPIDLGRANICTIYEEKPTPFSPGLALLRGDQLGSHIMIADSPHLTIDITDKEVKVEMEIWDGASIDVTHEEPQLVKINLPKDK